MRLQNGSLHLVTDGDLFKAIVQLNRVDAATPKEAQLPEEKTL